MNIWNDIKRKRIEEIKERTKPVDALPLIKAMIKSRDKMDDNKRKEILKALTEGFKKSGEMLLNRCFLENIMTEKEWKELSLKYNLIESDMSPILQCYFNKKDKVTKDEIIVVTMNNTSIFKHRDVLKKRFDVKIVSTEEAIEIMKTEDKKL